VGRMRKNRFFLRKKRGVFFSIDAVIAISIIFFAMLFIFVEVNQPRKESQVPGDLLKSFSVLKIGEIDNDYVRGLIADGKIRDLNKSVLEQIGEFYVTNGTMARELAEQIFSELDLKDNVGLWFGNELIYSVGEIEFEDAKNIKTETQWISGLQAGESVTGFSSRAYLESDIKSKYFYFGGYVGDGNVSLLVDYSGDIQGVVLEIACNSDFDVYINEDYAGRYNKSSSEFVPSYYNLGAHKDNFNSGENIVKLVGVDRFLYVAGGYFKITYKNPTFENIFDEDIYYFPGIEGLINIYDGVYIPGDLNEMEIYLHYNSSINIFLIMGNTTLYRGNSSGENLEVTINDATLSGLLNYGGIVNKTVPLRLGLENVSYEEVGRRNLDVFSVTDLSGSMDFWCSQYQTYCQYQSTCNSRWVCPNPTFSNIHYSTQNGCQNRWFCPDSRSSYSNRNRNTCNNNCNLDCVGCDVSCVQNSCVDNERMNSAKLSNKAFIEMILNSTGDRVGLIGYNSIVISSAFHNLSDNQTSLFNKIDSWTPSGGTCVCCGIHDAMVKLRNIGGDKLKFIVVMSDGDANVNCAGGSTNAKQSAIDKACEAYNDYGIIVHAVGFGSDADQLTLQSIADCGHGNYYFGDSTNLIEVYQEIASEVLKTAYFEQTIELSLGNFSSNLYPDSHIRLSYNMVELPYGLMISTEELFHNSTHAFFSVPENSILVDLKVVSYSGPRWTSKAKINGSVFYSLLDYNSPFIELGDPYKIQIPTQSVAEGGNVIEVYTVTSLGNESVGSEHNKIVYTIVKDFVSYSPISPIADGCTWEIQFEDDSYASVKIPIDYSGEEVCSYNLTNHNRPAGQDAINWAIYGLLQKLDFDSNGKIEFKFSTGDLSISYSEIAGIPYTWTTEVQVRRWD
jgi:hypothetical protein